MIRQPQNQLELVPGLLMISIVGFMFFGVAMTLVFGAASVWPRLFPVEEMLSGQREWILVFDHERQTTVLSPWLNGDAYRLTFAYIVGLIAATGICLPSLFFYGLLAGVRMTVTDVVIHALKSKAVAAMTLIGILPIYAVFGLAVGIFSLWESFREFILYAGLLLPFIAGLSGTVSLYRSLSMMTDTMSKDRRLYRECFLQRLVLSWAAVYTAVSPTLIFTLWQYIQG